MLRVQTLRIQIIIEIFTCKRLPLTLVVLFVILLIGYGVGLDSDLFVCG